MSTLMWEAVAAPGRADDLVAWAVGLGVGDVYRAADGRVVVIADNVTALGEPPSDTCVNPPRAWTFDRV